MGYVPEAAGLAPSEREILAPFARIAAERGIRLVMVRNAVYGIQRKLGVGSMQELVLCGAERAAGRLCRVRAGGMDAAFAGCGAWRSVVHPLTVYLLPSFALGPQRFPLESWGAIPPFRPVGPAAAGFPGPFPGAGR